MKKPIAATLWRAIVEAGFVAGIVATVFQSVGITGVSVGLLFISILLILTITIFNVRLFYLCQKEKPFVEYVSGHDDAFAYLTQFIKTAKDSIWVTRFSRGSITKEIDYFGWSSRRITGEECKPIYSYRRIMNIDSRDKAELVCEMIKQAGANNNFYLRKTALSMFFEILIIDGVHAFILFHEPGSAGTINAVLSVSRPDIVTHMKEIYDAIWNHRDTEIIKDSSLFDEEKQTIINEYSRLAKSLSH